MFSNILTYFLNLLHPGLKKPIQFVMINTPEKLLQAFQSWSSSRTWIISNFSFIVRNK
jgi:hypothetical protein